MHLRKIIHVKKVGHNSEFLFGFQLFIRKDTVEVSQ